MTLIVSSIFRDSAAYIDRWVDQVSVLQRVASVDVHAIVAEGDSTDGTADLLRVALSQAPFQTTCISVNHGGPKYDSYDIPDRWARIALVCNRVMDEVRNVIGEGDRFLYVESDLVWVPDDLAVLVSDLDAMPAVAPMSMRPNGDFYDIWGHRKDGIAFEPERPFHPELNGERFVTIDSAGSCFALRGRLAKTCRFSPVDCIQGIGRDVRREGDELWLDQQVEVLHP